MLSFAILVILGLNAVTASPVVVPDVVNGENATQGEFPFVVSFGGWGSGPICGGSLISDQWVLTAGHCIIERENEFFIYYGNVELYNLSSAVYPIVNISKIIRHPNFTYVENTEFLMRNDLALVKLEQPINFTANVQSIKLPKQNETVPSEATLVGWGRTGTEWWDQTNMLHKVNLTIFDQKECQRYNGRLNYTTDQNICAGASSWFKTQGQCNGDSGSPLFADGVQWGVVSWSIKPCASIPGVYTSTSVFVDWINSVIATN